MKSYSKDYILVGLQFVLFAFFLFDYELFPLMVPLPLKIVALIVSVIGGIILLTSILQLNTNLSPFPTPKCNSQLIQSGFYKYIRHPIYTGILLTLMGYAFYSDSSYRISITCILFILFIVKSIYEENKLSERFSQYAAYKKKTGRFFPKPFTSNKK